MNLHGQYQDALIAKLELLQLYKRTYFPFLLKKKKK